MSQISLPFDWQGAASGGDFLVSDANAQAVAHLERWRDWPLSVSVLTGPPLSGRSTLARHFAQMSGGSVIDDAQGKDEHALFHALRAQDYTAYAAALLHERELTQFPPYSFLALVKAEANDFALVSRFLKYAADTAHSLADEVLVYDPVRPQMERLKGLERGQLLMQSDNRGALLRLLRTLVPQLRAHALSPKVRWAVDVDPLEF